MKRFLFTLLAALSLLLSVFFIVASLHWYLQHPRGDFYPAFFHARVRQTTISVYDQFSVHYTNYAVEHNARFPALRQTLDWRLLGFHIALVRQVYYPNLESAGDNHTVEWGPLAKCELSLPGWACAIASGIIPVRWFITFARWRREARRLSGICVRCGYDLRATPDRCPECGTIVSKNSN